MSDDLRKFLDLGQSIKRDLDELGVSKPVGANPQEQKWIDDNWDTLGVAPLFNASQDIRAIIRRWRNMVERRAKNYLDTPNDYLGRMFLDEVAQIDAWLKVQEDSPAK